MEACVGHRAGDGGEGVPFRDVECVGVGGEKFFEEGEEGEEEEGGEREVEGVG